MLAIARFYLRTAEDTPKGEGRIGKTTAPHGLKERIPNASSNPRNRRLCEDCRSRGKEASRTYKRAPLRDPLFSKCDKQWRILQNDQRKGRLPMAGKKMAERLWGHG